MELSCPLASAVCRRAPMRLQRGLETGARRQREEARMQVPVVRDTGYGARATCDCLLSALHTATGRRGARSKSARTASDGLSYTVSGGCGK